MPVDLLKPHTHLLLRHPVPRRGRIAFEVYADLPVTTYVVDREGLEAFRAGTWDIPSYGGFTNRKNHEQELILPFSGVWYLLIVNDRGEDVDVTYEVFY